MKIIRFLSSAADSGREAVCHPDSTLLLPGRPLFYLDFGGGWSLHPHVAVHICRLGKGISVKFAPRYYDSISLAFSISPSEASLTRSGWMDILDSSITHGEWIMPDKWFSLDNAAIGETPLNIAAISRETIDAAITDASRYTTLRMGDILLLPLGSPTLPLAPRSRVVATAGQPPRELLNVKVV